MTASRTLAVLLLALSGSGVLAAELVGVPGSGTQYPATMEGNVGGKTVKMTLTGVALRQKYLFNVYAIGSYVEEGAGVRTAEELTAKDCSKRLHLVMERSVAGSVMAEAFQEAIRLNYAAPAFDAEVGQLVQLLSAHDAQKGDTIVFTHIPGVGLQCQMPGQADLLIKNVPFARAVWEIYLGKNNLGEAIKRGLVSRL